MTNNFTFTVKVKFTGPIEDIWHVQKCILAALVDWVDTAGLVSDDEEEITQSIVVSGPDLNDWEHEFLSAKKEAEDDSI